jgi:glycosyltransferase involved in cell wall biosynthesis
MKFLLYTKIGEDTVMQKLGLPEYSYYFVYKQFKHVFARLGEIVSLHTEEEIREQYQLARQAGLDCVVVFFCPPHVAPDIYPCTAFCVLAWEFDTIPNECWDNDARNDWRFVLNRHMGLVCLSSHTREAVKRTMGQDYLVCNIPTPISQHISAIANAAELSVKLETTGNIIDSHCYQITNDLFRMVNAEENYALKKWDGGDIRYVFNHEHRDSAFLGGCYHAEAWGTWTRLAQPWLFSLITLSGDFAIDMRLRAYGHTIEKTISVTIGGVVRSFCLDVADQKNYRLEFSDVPPSNLIVFSGLDLTPVNGATDARSMAIGFEELTISTSGERVLGDSHVECNSRCLELSGIIYTTVFNPADARKNWEDIVRAFCYAFKEQNDVCLVLKVTHHCLSSIVGKLHFLLQQIGAMQCRVVAIQGYLSDSEYEKLIHATRYYVNASSGEGLCLPLMEFMAAGVPSIAPAHTAMVDFVSQDTTFLVKHSAQPAIWPHDPRQKKKAISYRINWVSLVEQFRLSYAVITHDLVRYRLMADASSKSIQCFANVDCVEKMTENFLQSALSANGSESKDFRSL